jgi:hypothetical protein
LLIRARLPRSGLRPWWPWPEFLDNLLLFFELFAGLLVDLHADVNAGFSFQSSLEHSGKLRQEIAGKGVPAISFPHRRCVQVLIAVSQASRDVDEFLKVIALIWQGLRILVTGLLGDQYTVEMLDDGRLRCGEPIQVELLFK